MKCAKCNSDRILAVSAHCRDCFSCSMLNSNKEYDGYVLEGLGIGDGGDDVDFSYCLNCGQIVGDFPIATTELEGSNEDDIADFLSKLDGTFSKNYLQVISYDADDLGPIFKNWIENLFRNNLGKQIPSSEILLAMYEDNCTYIDSD